MASLVPGRYGPAAPPRPVLWGLLCPWTRGRSSCSLGSWPWDTGGLTGNLAEFSQEQVERVESTPPRGPRGSCEVALEDWWFSCPHWSGH